MMILQHSSVIIKKRSLASRHHVEIVCRTGVLKIVDKGSHKGGEYL